MMADMKQYGPLLLRVFLGLLMLIPGIMKLMSLISTGEHVLVGMLGMAGVWALALVEVLVGVSLLLGWMTKYVVWIPAVILAGAIFMVVIPGKEPMWQINLLFHLQAIAGYISLYLTGPGANAMDK